MAARPAKRTVCIAATYDYGVGFDFATYGRGRAATETAREGKKTWRATLTSEPHQALARRPPSIIREGHPVAVHNCTESTCNMLNGCMRYSADDPE